MDLPNLFTKEQPKLSGLFISLILTDHSVQSGLWQIIEKKIIFSNKSDVRYFGNEEERLIQIDESLQDLGKESESVSDVLLGLETNWVNEQGILPDRKKELKEICDKLSLKALGFVLVSEALQQYLVQKNAYISSVILYVGSSFIELSLIRQGKKVRSMSVGRSDDIILDLKEALARFDQEADHESKQLPANLLLASISLDQASLQQHQQQLLNQNWQQELNFIQTPVIDIFDQNKLLQIVTQQGGLAVAHEQGFIPSSQESLPGKEDQSLQGQAEVTSFGVPVGDNFQAPVESEQAVPQEQAAQPDMVEQDAGSLSSKKKGFKLNPFKSKKQQSDLEPQPIEPVRHDPPTDFIHQRKKPLAAKLIILIGVFAGLLATAAISFLYLKNSYQAQITIEPTVKAVSKEAVITLNPQIAESDAENQILKAQIVVKEVSDSDSVETTGVKLVGEKAEGEIIIFNKTDEEKSFAAGTELTVDETKFVLKETVIVPPAVTEEKDTGDGAVQEYGQIETEIIAVEIGAEGNIEEDTDLQVADFSQNTYQARTLEDLSGGSSREIRVVAEEDRQELLVSLRQRLLRRAKDEFESVSDDEKYIAATDTYEITAQNFSAEIGDETERLSLDLTLQLEGVAYTVEDLRLLAKSVLESEVPEDYELIEESLDYSFSQPSEAEDSGLITLDTDLLGSIRAKLDEQSIREEILGLTVVEARAKLSGMSAIETVNINIFPGFTRQIFENLPTNQKRILIQFR